MQALDYHLCISFTCRTIHSYPREGEQAIFIICDCDSFLNIWIDGDQFCLISTECRAGAQNHRNEFVIRPSVTIKFIVYFEQIGSWTGKELLGLGFWSEKSIKNNLNFLYHNLKILNAEDCNALSTTAFVPRLKKQVSAWKEGQNFSGTKTEKNFLKLTIVIESWLIILTYISSIFSETLIIFFYMYKMQHIFVHFYRL